MEKEEAYSSVKYPTLQTLLAFIATAAMSVLANFENYQELGFAYIAITAVEIGVMIMILLKLITIPCAAFIKMRSGLSFKHSYFETLKLVYFIPYGILAVGLVLFVGKTIVS